MSGPTRPTYGPRVSGGYQFPRTDSARLSRGEPIRVERLGDGAQVQIVPLAGGRRRLFDVCAQWPTRGAGGERCVMSASKIATDELEARTYFVDFVKEILSCRSSPATSG